jgi:glycine/D-amino acid oxidase-like deaminating enzyme
MPDVIVIGGGIIGTTTAWQLAERGAEVLLLERGALASGATARSQGLLLPPDHAEMLPLWRETLALYRRLVDETGIDVALDERPIGTLTLATDEHQLAELDRLTVPGERLDAAGVLEAEPALAAAHVAGGVLQHEGQRSDPAAITVAAAVAAERAGAVIRRHVPVRRIGPGTVVADDGVHHAGTIVLAAGAWSRALARTAGHDVEVRPVRGWLAIVAPGPPLLNHVIYEAEYDAPEGPAPGRPVTLGELAAGSLAEFGADGAHALGAHQNRDGTIMIGASRSAALRETDESADSLRRNAARACELLPELALREVATTWTGLRPFAADGIPYIGLLGDRLVVCAGHGSEGILTGAGSGRLTAQLVVGEEPFTDPAPFTPERARRAASRRPAVPGR